MAVAAHQRSPQRIDWGAARAIYIALGQSRTYGRVAREYGVSEGAVRQHASAEVWREAANAADVTAAEHAALVATRTLAERAAQNARMRDLTADLLEARLREPAATIEFGALVRILDTTDRMTRLDDGRATEAIEQQVSGVLDAVLDVFVTIVRDYLRPEREQEASAEFARRLRLIPGSG